MREKAREEFEQVREETTERLKPQRESEEKKENQKLSPTAMKPGSKPRTMVVQAGIADHSQSIQTLLQAPEAKLLAEEVEAVIIPAPAGQSATLAKAVLINPALPLKQEAANQAAGWLTEQLAMKGIKMEEEGLEDVAALFRACLAEGRRGNPQFVEKAWGMLNQAIAAAMTGQSEILLDMPLGDLTEVMSLPVGEVRRRIAKYLMGRNGNLLSNAESDFPLLD